MRSWGQALAETVRALGQGGVDSPRLDARLLLAQALGVEPAHVFSNPANRLDEAAEACLASLLARRLAREPMSHILGRREFWSLDFAVDANVLDPRPDTETLVEAVLDTVLDKSAPLSILDLGTGSGCILLSLLSELPMATGLGVDRSPLALGVATGNAARLALDHRAGFTRGDWGSDLTGIFDVIVSNPPYIPEAEIDGLEPEVARFEPRLALSGGADGLDCYRALIPDVARLLAPGGVGAFEIGAGQADDVERLIEAAGLVLYERRRDLAGVERCLILGHPGLS